MCSPEQPTNAKRDKSGGTGLCFDGIPQPLAKRGGRVFCLAVKVLGSSRSLIDGALYLAPCVTGDAAKSFLRFTANVFGGALYTILIHAPSSS